jgi:hypothetical protein
MKTCNACANLFKQQPRQLLPTVIYALTIRRVHHPDERVSLLEVVLPVRSQCLLAADIPWKVSMRPAEGKQV